MSLLELKDLYVDYLTEEADVHALRGMNLVLEKGDSIGLVGETGAGKTTTALSLLGLLPPQQSRILGGEIHWRGENILNYDSRRMENLRGKEIAMIFQDPMTSLNPLIKVDEQVAEMIRLHDKKLSKKESLGLAVKQLQSVGIQPERCGEYPHQFSGGMKQRVVIAMALACSPNLLIADEPTTALDVTIQSQVLELMKDLIKENGTTLIMITHDLGIVSELCDTIAIVYAGEILELAPKHELFANPMHPYTHGLLASIPDVTVEKETLEVLPGLPPEPTEEIKGCSFAPRCSRCMDRCRTERPVLGATDSENHSIACFNPYRKS
jgi:peptide/nickel transport system ATP-binding protein